MPAFKTLLIAMKAQQAWRRIPPDQRRAILEAAQKSAKKHGPTLARTVKQQGPSVAKHFARVIRESRKRR